jgi:MoaA/NifB/PqqE/SkfB family radical SAM enzyme
MTKYLDKLGSPELDWIQVEVTSRCNAACIYCPQPLLYQKQHMPFSLFEKILPYTGYMDLIYLQGWGEPLLNPDLFAMIRASKKKGKRVGFTTNGMLLNDENIRRLVDLETDIISVSLAGTTEETNNRIRKGTDLTKITSNLEDLQNIKERQRSAWPALHFAYIMFASNIHEIKNTVDLAKRLGAKQVICSNLALIIDETLWPESLFSRNNEQQRFAGMLDEISEEAGRGNILFAYNRTVADEQPASCSENVCSSCVVSVTGEVLPCVFSSPTLMVTDGRKGFKPLTHMYRKNPVSCHPLSFGNICKESLTRIWNRNEYIRFRKFHDTDTGATGNNPLPLPHRCASCYMKKG